MDRRKALEMLQGFEEMEARRLDLEPEDVAWWMGNVPGFPKELLTCMKGQSWNPSGEELPWNRRQRRSHQTAKGIIVHLFSELAGRRHCHQDMCGYSWIHSLALDLIFTHHRYGDTFVRWASRDSCEQY